MGYSAVAQLFICPISQTFSLVLLDLVISGLTLKLHVPK